MSKAKELVKEDLSSYDITIRNLALLKKHWEVRRDEVRLFMYEFGGISLYPVDDLLVNSVNDCGTSCCLLGLAPEIFKVKKEHFSCNRVFRYTLFSEHYFPYLHEMCDGILMEKPIWLYIFGSDWPDDLDHALQRIQDVIDGRITDLISFDDIDKLTK